MTCQINPRLFIIMLTFLTLLLPSHLYGEDTQTPTLKIGYIPITDHLLLGIAKNLDGSKYKNFKLDAIRFPDMGVIAEGIRSGDLDGGFLLAPLAFQSKLKGAPIKIVSLGHRNGSAVVVTIKPGINSVRDLTNKTIAVPHRFSTHNMLLHMFTSREGLTPNKDFKVLELGPTEMPSALAGGSIDGYIVAEPIAARSEVLGIGKVLVLSRDIWKDHPDCVLVLNQEFINKNPAAVYEFIESLIKAGIYAEINKESAIEIGAKFLGQPIEALRVALLRPNDRVTFTDLTPTIEELEKVQNYMGDKMNLFPTKVDIKSFVDNTFTLKAYQNINSSVVDKN